MTPTAEAAGRFTRRHPRPHWVVVTVVMAALVGALVVQGYVRREVGRSATGERLGLRTAPGSMISRSGGALRRTSPPPMTAALTFDDGPDPTWTPNVLDLLREKGVPATFFVVGAHVVAHPELV